MEFFNRPSGDTQRWTEMKPGSSDANTSIWPSRRWNSSSYSPGSKTNWQAIVLLIRTPLSIIVIPPVIITCRVLELLDQEANIATAHAIQIAITIKISIELPSLLT
jgi:hypothetical protein